MQGIEYGTSSLYGLGMSEAPIAMQETSRHELLSEKLKQASDVSQRRALLKQFRALLRQADDVKED